MKTKERVAACEGDIETLKDLVEDLVEDLRARVERCEGSIREWSKASNAQHTEIGDIVGNIGTLRTNVDAMRRRFRDMGKNPESAPIEASIRCPHCGGCVVLEDDNG